MKLRRPRVFSVRGAACRRKLPMRDLIDPAWQQEEESDWPTQAEMDELAAEITDEEWAAEQNRIRELGYGPLPSLLY